MAILSVDFLLKRAHLLSLSLSSDQESYRESCRMRPRLPSSKQRMTISLFDSTSLVSVVSQTVVHLCLMQAGILFARNVEAQHNGAATSDAKPLIRVAKSQAPKIGTLLGTLIKSNANALNEDKEEKKTNFLGQPKFVPNYETNVVCKQNEWLCSHYTRSETED